MGILRLRWLQDFRMARCTPALRWTLCAMLCLSLLGETGALSKSDCISCQNVWKDGCGDCLGSVARRSYPTQYDDFGAFLRKWIRASSEAPSCELKDIYKAIPPRCHAKLDWIVSQAEGFQ